MRAFLAGTALAFALVWAVPTFAQAVPEMDCWSGRPDARCAAERARRQQLIYGLPSVERLGAEGVQVRRAFYVDSSGRDAGALSFTRPPGQVPTVSFQPPRENGRLNPPMTAEVPLEIWQEVLSRSVNFDRAFAPVPPEPNVVCLHGWGYNVEAFDLAFHDEPASLRRRADGACYPESPTPEYAFAMSNLAIGLFPSCMRLEPRQHRNAVTRLQACASLAGDRWAAADVRNAIDALIHPPEPPNLEAVRTLFAEAASLDWGGEQVSGRAAAGERWLRGNRENRFTVFRTDRIEGETVDRVTVEGSIAYNADTMSASDRRRARVNMVWERGPGGAFLVVRATVGQFERVPD